MKEPVYSKLTVALWLASATLSIAADPFVPQGTMVNVWPGVAPGSEGKTAPERWIAGSTQDAFHRVTDIHVPTLTVYLPPKEKATGAAFIIAPGGGHRYVVVDLEGESVANKLNELGIAAFVLRYRLARAEGSTYKIDDSLADLKQAMTLVRARAKEWNVNPERVGVMGFSAGGLLAAMAANQFAPKTGPNFVVLGYPGLSFPGVGKMTASKNSPPTFMFVNDDDSLATSAGEYFLTLRNAGVRSELHVFVHGGHGHGATGRSPEFMQLGVSKWPELLGLWMKELGFLPADAAP